jgi:molecular chaperone DnaK
VGIPPAPRGMPQVEVTFDIDANGIVNVSAKDLGTGKEQKITITASSGLNEEEIKRMVGDAESHASEDKQRRQQVEDRNRLDNLVYTTEKTLAEHRDKLGAPERAEIDEALAQGKRALESNDASSIGASLERLTQASHKLAESMYRRSEAAGQQAPPPGEAPGPGAAGGGRAGEVIDAEYVDVDDKSN